MASKIYTENDIIENILEKIPEFRPTWEEYLNNWENRQPIGIDVAEFSWFVREKLRAKEIKTLQKSFDLIENFLAHGDEKVKNYMYFEFIENLSNEYEGYTEEEMKTYMGPLSLKALDRINAFWMEGKIIESLD